MKWGIERLGSFVAWSEPKKEDPSCTISSGLVEDSPRFAIRVPARKALT
jgi:hypothetical protein